MLQEQVYEVCPFKLITNEATQCIMLRYDLLGLAHFRGFSEHTHSVFIVENILSISYLNTSFEYGYNTGQLEKRWTASVNV